MTNRKSYTGFPTIDEMRTLPPSLPFACYFRRRVYSLVLFLFGRW